MWVHSRDKVKDGKIHPEQTFGLVHTKDAALLIGHNNPEPIAEQPDRAGTGYLYWTSRHAAQGEEYYFESEQNHWEETQGENLIVEEVGYCCFCVIYNILVDLKVDSYLIS